jgi:hypothetical protein
MEVLSVDLFRHIIIVAVFLFMPHWRRPHELPKHVGGLYTINIHSISLVGPSFNKHCVVSLCQISPPNPSMHFTSSHTCYLTFPSSHSSCIQPSNVCRVLIMKFLLMQCVHVSCYTLFLLRTPCWKTTPFLLSATSYSAYWQTPRISGGRILLIVVTWTQSLNVIQVYFSSHEVKYLVWWQRQLKTVRLWAHFPNFVSLLLYDTLYSGRRCLNIRRNFPPPSSGSFSHLLPECRTSHSTKLT